MDWAWRKYESLYFLPLPMYIPFLIQSSRCIQASRVKSRTPSICSKMTCKLLAALTLEQILPNTMHECEHPNRIIFGEKGCLISCLHKNLWVILEKQSTCIARPLTTPPFHDTKAGFVLDCKTCWCFINQIYDSRAFRRNPSS